MTERLEAVRKRKQEVLARKARIDADIVEQEALLKAYNDSKAIKLQELSKQKKELKKQKSALKAEKTKLAEDVKVMKLIYSGYKDEFEEFKAAREAETSTDGVDDGDTTAEM